MAKIGLVIFCLFVGLLLGNILSQYVCDINKTQELGTGKPIINLTCKILSNPIDFILLIVAIGGAVVYYIKTKEE
jgi:hypothetical protein